MDIEEALRHVAELREAQKVMEHEAVVRARQRGVSWLRIAKALKRPVCIVWLRHTPARPPG